MLPLTALAPVIGAVTNAVQPAASAAFAPASGADGGVSFAQYLQQLSSETVDTMKTAEAVSISGVQGKASVQQVVDAIMAAERTLQTSVAVRDKLIGAYQEISRMTI